MNWDEKARDELRRLWLENHSVSTIGRIMGISKNAVVGKAHRMKLPVRPSPINLTTEFPKNCFDFKAIQNSNLRLLLRSYINAVVKA